MGGAEVEIEMEVEVELCSRHVAALESVSKVIKVAAVYISIYIYYITITGCRESENIIMN